MTSSTMPTLQGKIACITGASAGIGEACARVLAREGAALLLSARRIDRVKALANDLGKQYGVKTHVNQLDVQKRDDVTRYVEGLPPEWQQIDILVNNAGLSRGLDKLHEGSIQDWEEMIDTNIKGLLYVTRAVVPGMVKRDSGHVINIGSIAGHQLYPSGNVYCATKFAVNALSQGLRMDLLGTQVRVSSVDPGMVQTEFSEVRFRGNKDRAKQVYANIRPLRPEDVAEVVLFCATRPPHVDIAEVVVMPTAQASVNHFHRTS
jgi:3-hydroxy acid dehydrogenase / malonic semialdehyde reductase